MTTDVFSVAFNFRYSWQDQTTKQPFRSCLGSVYFDFGPYLRDTVASIHNFTFTPGDFSGYIDRDLNNTTIGFQPNTSADVDDANVNKIELDLSGSGGVDTSFRGPYATTGQLDLNLDGTYDATQSVPDGQVLTSDQVAKMCFFVKGVVEKTGLDDTTRRPAKRRRSPWTWTRTSPITPSRPHRASSTTRPRSASSSPPDHPSLGRRSAGARPSGLPSSLAAAGRRTARTGRAVKA